jgi:hypothetical protein
LKRLESLPEIAGVCLMGSAMIFFALTNILRLHVESVLNEHLVAALMPTMHR